MVEKRKKPEPPKPDDPEQSKRFEEAARLLEADKSGKPFEEALQTVIEKPKQTSGG